MFFYALTVAEILRKLFEHEATKLSGQTSRGARQVSLKWNKHVWSLFLYILPDSNQNLTKTLLKHRISLFLDWISIHTK